MEGLTESGLPLIAAAMSEQARYCARIFADFSGVCVEGFLAVREILVTNHAQRQA